MTFTQDEVSRLFKKFGDFPGHGDDEVAYAYGRLLATVELNDIDEALSMFLEVNAESDDEAWSGCPQESCHGCPVGHYCSCSWVDEGRGD